MCSEDSNQSLSFVLTITPLRSESRVSTASPTRLQLFVCDGGITVGILRPAAFVGEDPKAKALVANLSSAEIDDLKRGGHDFKKLYADGRTARLALAAANANTIGYIVQTAIESRAALRNI